MLRVALRFHTRATAIRLTRSARARTSAVGTHASRGTNLSASPAVRGVAVRVDTAPLATDERRLARHTTFTRLAANDGAGLGDAGFAASSAVQRVAVHVDAVGAAGHQSVATGECTGPVHTNRGCTGRCRALDTAGAAVCRIRIE